MEKLHGEVVYLMKQVMQRAEGNLDVINVEFKEENLDYIYLTKCLSNTLHLMTNPFSLD